MIKARIVAALAVSLYLFIAGDPFSGTWKLNLSKSKLPPPLPQSQTVRVEADSKNIRILEEIVSDKGERTRISVDAKFDGKDYRLTGSPVADTVAYQRVDRYTIKGIGKKAGTVVMKETVVVSKDGKTLTGTYSGTDPTGKQITGIAVFEKQ